MNSRTVGGTPPAAHEGSDDRASVRLQGGVTARAADALIRLYQQLTAGRPSPCRYWPTCSNYAREAIESHGFWRGCALTARRLGRCRPLAPSGFDPVPPPRPTRTGGDGPVCL